MHVPFQVCSSHFSRTWSGRSTRSIRTGFRTAGARSGNPIAARSACRTCFCHSSASGMVSAWNRSGAAAGSYRLYSPKAGLRFEYSTRLRGFVVMLFCLYINYIPGNAAT